VYKSRKEVSQALQEIKELSKKQFHPEVVEVALEVLKDVELNDQIVQEPKTEIEKEKFLYYFKDNITSAFNSKYLDVMLYQNRSLHKYNYLYFLYIHNFSYYNKKYGWEAGDEFLKNFAIKLMEKYPQAMLFRIQGDDFALLCEEALELSWLEKFHVKELEELYISYNSYDLKKISDIEFLQKVIYH
jgi:GGDEF domain-containing protein